MSKRDMVGYGETPPHPHWPNGARVAVQFVINYEEGGERTLLNGDDESESYLSEIVGTVPVQGKRDLNVESIYEYGSKAGFWRLHRLFEKYDLPLTVYGVTRALELNPDAVAAMKRSGWEIASHGLRWIDYANFSEEEERAHLMQTLKQHTEFCGQRPQGWYTGRISENTRRLLVEEGGFLYDSDDYSDDLPYWNTAHGRPHLVIPYALDSNDFRFAMPQGFNSGTQFFDYLRDSFDYLYDEGAQAPKLLNIGLHCRISGRAGRTAALQKFIEQIKSHDDVWICRRIDIARHWHANFHPDGTSQ